MSEPSLKDLRLFVSVCRAGSLTSGALRLGLGPNAASLAVKRLEAALGVRLLRRTTRAMTLTPEGERYFAQVERVLAGLDEARAEVTWSRDQMDGTVRLSAPADLARHWLLAVLDAFQAAHPAVRVELMLGDPVLDVVHERVDLALRLGDLPDSALVARRLVDDHRIAVASPSYLERAGHPRHPEDLLHHECLTWFRAGNPRRQWVFSRGEERVAVEVQGRRAASDGEIVRRWALQGHGIAYKSRVDVRADLRSGALEALLPDWEGEHAPLHVVLPGHGRRPARVRALVEHLVAAAPSLGG
jgi:DNA-binding transcriptional LysR family regulator